MTGSASAPSRAGRFYRAVWRWHFLVGVLVLPFLFLLAFSGLLMLLSKPLDTALNQSLQTVEAGADPLPASVLLQTVEQQYPHAAVKLYLPPQGADQSARFSLQPHFHAGHGGHHAPATVVYLNPYTGELLGDHDPAASLYARIKEFHGSLFLGDLGDALIEIAAGLAVLMIITGLYLAWPKGGLRVLMPSRSLRNREDWRGWHLSIGWLIALPLLFFLISGLAWTNIWGGQLVQPWGSLPGTGFDASKGTPTVVQEHASMNEAGLHRVPWAVEQTPMPQSTPGNHPLRLDAVVSEARSQGFGNFRVHFPQQDSGVWTVSATTIAGDLTNPGDERILHLDQSTGQVLQDIRFADYPAMGKAMAASIPFHQGDLGLWNWLLNLLLVTLILALTLTGGLLWWKRQSRRAPPRSEPAPARTVAAIMLVIAVAFPLSAAALLAIILVDALLSMRKADPTTP
ncbi:MAG: PepSY-associated TM helix domain-containing protein [Alcanivorax sp.]|uniref:PepSY-associated TM helix domain-containing protein n=1 Tax=Alcanivorax sp. TaxID=1872427 RepID=UPI003DA74C3F